MLTNLTAFMTYAGSTDTQSATSALTQAEGLMYSIIGDVSKSQKTEYHDLNWEIPLVLKRYPIDSVSEIKIDGIVQDLSTFSIKNDSGIIRKPSWFSRGYLSLEVTYTAGYDDATIPVSLKYAVWNIAKIYLTNLSTLWSNVKKETVDGASIEWGDLGISDQVKIIESYKQYHV